MGWFLFFRMIDTNTHDPIFLVSFKIKGYCNMPYRLLVSLQDQEKQWLVFSPSLPKGGHTIPLDFSDLAKKPFAQRQKQENNGRLFFDAGLCQNLFR